MKGNIGCPCDRCRGAGQLHGKLKAKLEAFELQMGCELVVTSGYRCASHNAAVGGVKKSRHLGNPGICEASRAAEKTAYAADFWPDDTTASGKPKWQKLYRKRHVFLAWVEPYFHYSYINQSSADNYRKWSVHGQLC